jgi:hypothetical protein
VLLIAITPISATSPSAPESAADFGPFNELFRLQRLVEDQNACALPGCVFKYDNFMSCLHRAWSKGLVRTDVRDYVADGMTRGFTLGAQRDLLEGQGQQIFRNYKSAYEGRDSVSDAVYARLDKGRSLFIGTWSECYPYLRQLFKSFKIFPLGAVPKPHDPLVLRPVSDHRKSGFNRCTTLGILQHSLNVEKDVAWFLEQGFFMYVADVEDAFTLIPLCPWLWPYFFFRWYLTRDAIVEDVFVNLFGDFGTMGMPGTFKIVFVDCIVQMARAAMVLTLPMTVFVDDVASMGGDPFALDVEMAVFMAWCTLVIGVTWKLKKVRRAANPQLYIGFWWDSRTFTLTLDEEKLVKYLDVLQAAGESRTLNLRDRQRLAGKMQRAIRTMPPGAACLLVNCYIAMHRLVYAWRQRRTTKAERDDYIFVHDMLELNMGRGYYSYDGFTLGPEYRSDASGSRDFSAAGYVGQDGFYDYYYFGTNASKRPIDSKEGHAVVTCCWERAHLWRGCMIPFAIDNTVIERNVAKGRAGVQRNNQLMRSLFVCQLRHGFVLMPYWISTHLNTLADDLSRDRLSSFLRREDELAAFLFAGAVLQCHPQAGRVLGFDDPRYDGMQALRQLLKYYSSNYGGDGPSRGHGVGGDAQLLSLRYSQTSLFEGLPPEYHERLDEVLDNRLALSSRDKMMTGVARWSAHCQVYGWDPLMPSGFEERGGRMASWVLSMVDDTLLTAGSIGTYLWGMRAWHVLQHQDDPAFGVHNWRALMQSVAVLTATPSEPRVELPYEIFLAMLAALDFDCFADVNFGLMLLVLFFTFSRSECPCPKSWTGRHCFDAASHWQVRDFKLVRHPSGHWVLWVRFKAIKQDPRIERPSASASVEWLPFEPSADSYGRDWVPIGDVADEPLLSISRWYMRYCQLLAREREPDEPMFLSRDKARCYTYSCLTSDFVRHRNGAGGSKGTVHGVRVLGYNRSRRGNGLELTVVHGGWFSEGHSRYARFSTQDVLGISAGMVGRPSAFADSGARPIARDRGARGTPGRGSATPAAAEAEERAEDLSLERVTAADLSAPGADQVQEDPPGYSREARGREGGRRYFVWIAPDGTTLRSRRGAWAHAALAPPSPPSPSQGGEAGSSDEPPAHSARGSVSPVAGRAQDVDYLHEIVPWADRPSSRRAPVPRRRSGGAA